MSRRILGHLFAIAALSVSSAQAQSIDIILDPGDPVCSAQVGSTPFIELHVIAMLEGNVAEFQGAQFQVMGVPDTWNQENVAWVWDASVTLALGNPLFGTHPNEAGVPGPGAAVAWSTCQNPVGARTVRIGKILVYGAPTTEGVTLHIESYRLNRQEPNCPLVIRCDTPFFSKVCVRGGSFVLNGTNRICRVTAVEETTWSRVKNLYQ